MVLLADIRPSALLVFNPDGISVGAEKEQGIFSYEELKKLHYLHEALTESLRVFPPVPFNLRTTVHDDVLIEADAY
ncbi:Cytochrome P450 [Morella rubra]|uniref:Cytochrome P450 n=1 Tax=Morella rubra TaxID=262757 RepID=A0A6A1UJ14_9ROSI|nr:Cytochrome P450 [Morella rubra]